MIRTLWYCWKYDKGMWWTDYQNQSSCKHVKTSLESLIKLRPFIDQMTMELESHLISSESRFFPLYLLSRVIRTITNINKRTSCNIVWDIRDWSAIQFRRIYLWGRLMVNTYVYIFFFSVYIDNCIRDFF